MGAGAPAELGQLPRHSVEALQVPQCCQTPIAGFLINAARSSASTSSSDAHGRRSVPSLEFTTGSVKVAGAEMRIVVEVLADEVIFRRIRQQQDPRRFQRVG